MLLAPTEDSTHPSPTMFDPSTCVRKGRCPVSKKSSSVGRGDLSTGSTPTLRPPPSREYSLYYEQHGSGPEKVVFIAGMNSSSFAWAWQVPYFTRLTEYSVLVFDNRGVGNSDAPVGPYSTSGMAEDLLVLLQHLQWDEPRQLHIVGTSLGGMIAQEVATRIPSRIASLTLAVTSAGGWPWYNLPPLNSLISLASIVLTADVGMKTELIVDLAFPQGWLALASVPEDAYGSEKRTNREIVREFYKKVIATSKPQSLVGHTFQMAAGLTHNVSPARLRSISARIPKVLVLTGAEDKVVTPDRSYWMKAHMPEAELIVLEGTGHGIHSQDCQRFNKLLQRVFEEGRVGSKEVSGV
ncbi:alpha beta-hydrolase [Cytidiella melzeri]|nr:alpha beta-hydrolase [Cytidiella melzeri]